MNGPSTPLTRPSLLLRIRDADDRQAWETFFETYSPLVYRYARWKGLQEADANDVVQRVLWQVSRSIRSFAYDPQRGRFRDWLGTAVRHEIGRVWKLKAKQTAPFGGSGDHVLDAVADHSAERAWVEGFEIHVCHQAVGRIRGEFDDETWWAFEEVWKHDRSSVDVAAELGRPVQWVYKATFRVRQRLKAEIQVLAEDCVVQGL